MIWSLAQCTSESIGIRPLGPRDEYSKPKGVNLVAITLRVKSCERLKAPFFSLCGTADRKLFSQHYFFLQKQFILRQKVRSEYFFCRCHGRIFFSAKKTHSPPPFQVKWWMFPYWNIGCRSRLYCMYRIPTKRMFNLVLFSKKWYKSNGYIIIPKNILY